MFTVRGLTARPGQAKLTEAEKKGITPAEEILGKK
jgi:hypothetical protein